MDTVSLLAVEFIFGIFAVHYLPRIYGLFFFFVITTVLGIALRKREIFYWVIPVLFILRIFTGTSEIKFEVGDKFHATARVYEGRGRIEKISDRFPYGKDYIILEKIPDGKYKIQGTVQKITDKKYFKEYRLDSVHTEKVPESFLQKGFRERVSKVTRDSKNEEKNLYNAVVLGVKEPLYPRIKNLFAKSGASHLLAISGLHMGIVAAVLDYVLKKLKISKRNRSLIIIGGLTLYFAGIRFSPSVQRAYIMMMIIFLGRVFYENSDMMKSLSLAFIISIIIDPTGYLEASMILSYSAIIIIWAMAPKLSQLSSVIKERMGEGKAVEGGVMIFNYLIFTLSLQLGMIPVVYFLMGNISMKGILISLIATPVGMIYIILCFISLIFPIMPLTNLCYNFLIGIMEFFH